MTLLGWLANALCVVGVWGVGSKRRGAFLVTIAGELLWVVVALDRGMYDLAAVCLLFGVLAFRSWYQWRPTKPIGP
jgi:hypothetical protein